MKGLLAWTCVCLAAGGAAAAEIGVWAAPDGCKIDRSGRKLFVQDANQKIDQLKRANHIWDSKQGEISLAGARGETVAFQLGIAGGEAGLEDVNVALTALAGPGGATIPAKRIELFKIYYTRVADKGSGPTNRPSMGKGWYPDALVPWSVPDTTAYGGYDGPPFLIAPTETQGVWVDASIPYGTPAGAYAGKVRVTAKGAPAKELTVRLRVYNFDIPRKIHSLFFMNYGLSDLNQAGGYWLKGEKLARYEVQVHRTARRHRFTAGNMYHTARPAIKESAKGLISVDWSKYDARFDKFLNPRKNVFGPGAEPVEIWKAPLFAMIGRPQPWPKNPKAWDQMIVEIKKHWKQRGWDLSRAYVYLADEPGKDRAEKLNDYARRVKASPGAPLRRQIAVYTILGRTWNSQQWVFDLWKDNLDMWMVAGDYYHVPSMNRLPAGCLKGMYQGAEPFQGNEPLDADGVAMRTWSWIAWQYRIDYLCYYSMAEAWRGYDLRRGKSFENNNCQIWDRPRNRKWAVSQGVFIYPGKRVGYDLPIVNIRMKQIRRGQTDYEYFWLLRHAGEGALADRLVKKVINVALSEAASAPERYGYGKWSHNPRDWDQAIRAAAERLEKLTGKLPKEPARGGR